MQAPLIDPRRYADIVAQTEQLAGQLSGWQPLPDGQPDAGRALIGVFGRFAELLIERLNRAPDKNYLAFLNLIGAAPLPPRPARVPLTFHLATGSLVSGVVPAGSLAAAPPLAGGQDDVVFETEQTLVVTPAQLQAVFVSDTENDTYDDRKAEATGTTDQPFAVFTGDQRSLHQLFLAADPLLTQPGPKAVTITLASQDTWQWQNWPISWAYWDGASWQAVVASSTAQNGSWQVNLQAVPTLTPSTVNGIEAGWLRAQLDMPFPPGQSGQSPDSIAIGARNPQDCTLPLSPFPADSSVQRFYLSADEAFFAGGAQVTIHVRLSQPGAGNAVQLNWYYQDNAGWQSLGQSGFTDGTLAFTQDGDITFHVPMSWPSTMYRSRTGRWLRIDVNAGGQYTTPPEFAELTVGYDWQFPLVGGISVTGQPGAPAGPAPPPAAFCNATGIDLSKDFYPLGQQPQFNDTFYVACPDTLARPGAVVTLSVTLTNPPQSTSALVPPVRPGDNPRVTWEVSDGSQWHTAAAADYAFTDHGQVSLTLPDPVGPSSVNGEQGYWLRARLVDGGYGRPASYQQSGSTYTYQPANFAPPVIKAIALTATAAQLPPIPVTACLTYNDFRYTDHTGRSDPFPPFSPTADTQPALYLGFDQPFGPHPVTMFLEVEPPLPDQVVAGQVESADPVALTTWDYASADGWQPLGAVDETQALSAGGLVTFIGPADLAQRSFFGQALYWLRLRWQAGTFALPPQLRRVLPNTVWAAQVTTVDNEILGSGNGDPGQSFTAAQAPIQPGPQVTVRGSDDIWAPWQAVPDFYQSGPQDRHYTADLLSGVIQFGDGTYGMIPPIGQSNIRMTYQAGGGKQGNRASATIVQLKSAVPYIDGVTNNQPSQGGASAETIGRAKARAPRVLRHRDRAVAAQDLADLAIEASSDVAAAAVIVPQFDAYSLWLDPNAPVLTPDHTQVQAGQMGVIIVPDDPDSARPTPSLGLLSQVQDYLRARCPPTADLWVAGPDWICVTVQATVVAIAVEDADATGDRARAAVRRYLHPLTGGPDGHGWAFGSWPHASDLSALLEAVQGVDHVRSLSVTYQPESTDNASDLQAILDRPMTDPGDAPERDRELASWLDRALVYSGTHDVSVALS